MNNPSHEGRCVDCGRAPATMGRFCAECVERTAAKECVKAGMPAEGRDPAVVRRELRIRCAACMVLLHGVRGVEAGRAAGIAAVAEDHGLAELPAVMLAAVRFHLGTVPAALAVFEAALAAEEHEHAVIEGADEIAAEARANRLVLLCRNTVAGEARDRLETGLEAELRTYGLVRGPDDEGGVS